MVENCIYLDDMNWVMMMSFSTGTGVERVGVVGSDQDNWWAGL